MEFQFRGRVIFFATNNINKFNEARQVLKEYNIAVGMLRVKNLEVQSDYLEEIAETSVLEAHSKSHLPLIVEDAGLFVEALNGFPGPYAAYVYKTIGNKGLLKLMENKSDRRAKFRSILAYQSEESEAPLCFSGEVAGILTDRERRKNHDFGFGFDPVFIPFHRKKTFAEMDLAEKNKCSHRAQALRKFAEWYKKLQ
jgi:XTP/dITP diphosphohydrolase